MLFGLADELDFVLIFLRTAHHTRFAVLNHFRTAHHTRSTVLNTAIFFGSTSLTPTENGTGEFSGSKKCQHFPGKTVEAAGGWFSC